MAEVAFLQAVRSYLEGPAGISPAFAAVGYAKPAPGDSFPMAALALPEVERVDIGLGGGKTEVSDGALQIVSTIDLANPVLAGTGGFSLLDAPRTGLILPHGGLIRADAMDGALGPADLTITVDGAPRNLVAAAPGAAEFTVEAQSGQVTFGAALPATGDLVATYHLGIWERATTLIRGTLALGCWDTNPTRLPDIADQSARALMAAAQGALPGLQKIRLVTLGEISERQTRAPGARERPALFRFDFEHVVDVPLSSGGIIARVATTSRLAAFVRDPSSGAMIENTVIETDE